METTGIITEMETLIVTEMETLVVTDHGDFDRHRPWK